MLSLLCKTLFTVFLLGLASLSFAAQQLIIEAEAGPDPILKAIHHAQSSIDLAMYGFTEPRLMAALIQAKQEGKAVRILLQHTPYKNEQENRFAIKRFKAQHLALHFAPPRFLLLHQKTLIIDHRLAIVMTFNFTRSAFKKDRNFGLIISDPKLVKEIEAVFSADWAGESAHPTNPLLVWSPVNSREKVLNLVANAKTEIKIYAQGLSDYQFIGALAKAARRGVKVEILTSTVSLGKKWTYLQEAGVHFHRDKHRVIHAKVLIIDRQQAVLGSLNFTKPSFDNNRELSVITRNTKLLSSLLNCFSSDWQQA